jgi:hypothetical protein
MFVKNFWSNQEINDFYKNHPLLDRIYEHEKGWFVLFKDQIFNWHDKDEHFQPERSKREDSSCCTRVYVEYAPEWKLPDGWQNLKPDGMRCSEHSGD